MPVDLPHPIELSGTSMAHSMGKVSALESPLPHNHQRVAPNGRQPFARMGKQDPGLAGVDYILFSKTSPDDLFNDLQGF